MRFRITVLSSFVRHLRWRDFGEISPRGQWKPRWLIARGTSFFCVFLFYALFSFAIDWEHDLKAALDKAKSVKKPVMADFFATWCGPCKRLNDETFNDSKVESLTGEFICVKIDVDENPDLVRQYGVRGYPTVIFFDENGRVVGQSIGYRDAAFFTPVMRNALEKAGKLEKEEIKSQKPAAGTKTISSIAKPRIVEQKIKRGPFELSGIIFSSNNPKAVINDNVVGVGDSVDGAKVLNITETMVKLEYNGDEISLGLE